VTLNGKARLDAGLFGICSSGLG